jgi:hypothetical protein
MDKSDREWVNKYMEENFPKFQWSIFPPEDKETQIVVRGNDFQTFLLDIESVKAGILTTASTQPTKVCPICGSPVILGESKDGTKKFEKCSENKWDPVAKKGIGCTYIKFL